ncbi:MAG: SLC13 family permease [Planctomycetota bacterium]|jgi:di/tricarboxylate transporter
MGWEAIFCLFVLALVFAGLLLRVSPDALLLGAAVLVALAGIITPEQALMGFSNQAVLTVGALYVIAAAMRETGALGRASSLILGKARSENRALLRMAGILPGISAFLNNTPIVAMFIPIISDWCRKNRVAASRLLIPLSYLCILGGTCTLIGTSTNLVVNGLMQETARSSPEIAQAVRPIHFFELSYVGLPYAIVGIAYLLLVGVRLLPHRKGLMEQFTDVSREYLVDLLVKPGCRLVGQTVQEAGLRNLSGLFLVEISRSGSVVAPVTPNQLLEANDVLTFTGVVSNIVDLERIPGLVPIVDDHHETEASQRREGVLCEAVVSPNCPSVGRTIRDADFRALYNAAVIAVHRGGQRLCGKVGDIVLRSGDTLLLQADPHFIRANRNNPDFLLVSGVENSQAIRHDKALYSLILLVILVILMVTGITSIVIAALLIAGLMTVTRCISISQARHSIDWRTLITIASALGLAKALDASGLAASVSTLFVGVAGQCGTSAILGSLYLITSIFAAIIGNNAAAALIFPFAIATGQQLGLSPRPFIMAVVFAASASFISPLSYQTNLMVYGPGSYRFTDFIRVGLPLSLLLLICATLLIPLVWTF